MYQQILYISLYNYAQLYNHSTNVYIVNVDFVCVYDYDFESLVFIQKCHILDNEP